MAEVRNYNLIQKLVFAIGPIIVRNISPAYKPANHVYTLHQVIEDAPEILGADEDALDEVPAAPADAVAEADSEEEDHDDGNNNNNNGNLNNNRCVPVLPWVQ